MRSSGNIVIAQSTGPGESFECSTTHFVPDAKYGQMELDNLNQDFDIYWLGSWHVHPRNFCALSGIDTRMMRRFIDDSECLNYFVEMVFSASGDTMQYRSYIMNDTHQLIEVNIVVENSGPINEMLLPFKKESVGIANNIRTKKTDELSERLLEDIRVILQERKMDFMKFEDYQQYLEIALSIKGNPFILIIPKDKVECPILLRDDTQVFVPINWNRLLTIEDFIDAIPIK